MSLEGLNMFLDPRFQVLDMAGEGAQVRGYRYMIT